MRKLLIATSNKDKAQEMRLFLQTLPFEIMSLSDLEVVPPPPEEGEASLVENALLKAQYYAEQTGELALADDSGLFIDALEGWPGVTSANVGSTYAEARAITLQKMEGVDPEKRTAAFMCVMALFDPLTRSRFVCEGDVKGFLLETDPIPHENGFGFDPIFLVSEKGKTFKEMSLSEKNDISHRGAALQKMKYHLQNTYAGRHIVVPIALIINDEGKIYMQRRNDPFRQEFHGKWEFPGGTVEMGERVEDTLVREVKEEAGMDVQILGQIPWIRTKYVEAPTHRYQLYLPSFVCKATSEAIRTSDQEVLEHKWFAFEEIPSLNLFEGDGEMIQKIHGQIEDILQKQ